MAKAHDDIQAQIQRLKDERNQIAPPLEGSQESPAGVSPTKGPSNIRNIRVITKQISAPGTTGAASPPHTEGADATSASSTASLPDEAYRNDLMADLAYGKGYQRKAAKDLLKTIVGKVDDAELAKRAQGYGLQAYYNTNRKEPALQTSSDPNSPDLTREQLEQMVYDAAIQKGWK